MMSVNLEKSLEHLKIQESLRSENLTEYYLCKGIFLFFSTLKDITQAQNKTNHWISWNFIIICLKGIPEECVLFNVNIDASLKFPWALKGLSEGTQALKHSEDTWALGGHSST